MDQEYVLEYLPIYFLSQVSAFEIKNRLCSPVQRAMSFIWTVMSVLADPPAL